MLQDFASGALTPNARARLTSARDSELNTAVAGDRRVLEVAYSDDLAFLNELGLLAYLQLDKVGTCGIDPAVFGRVGSKDDLQPLAEALDTYFAIKPEQPPPVPNVTLRGRYYTTPRENGYSHEYIGVRFTDGKPDLMLTLTTANPQELAFQSRGHDKIAPLVEIARQRKMAASLIRDYVVRTALARQYEAGKEILPGVTAIAAPGHTPGHTVYAISSGNGKLMVMSDTTNHPALFVRNPDWSAVFDMDGPQAAATRRKLLDMAVTDKMQVAFYHAPFPATGHIAKAGNGFELVPVQWSSAI